ncbi:MAG TPA: asparaginase [Actinomycetota bacterium]
MAGSVPLVRVVRSGLEESVHLGHVAVCDAEGRVVAYAGDPHRPVFARSAMKPLQAAVSLQAIGGELPDDQVAVMCASHNGEPVHVRTVRRLLRTAGLGVSALRNPPGWPLDPRSMAEAERPRRVLHNCSGKHAGMVAACARAGWDQEAYPEPGHPLQRRVLRAVLRGTDLPEVHVGVDGCGVPVHGMSLRALAMLYARLARPDRFGSLAGAVARSTAAMRAQPYLVGGRGRTDTAVMQASARVLVKSGAEGLSCAAVLEPALGVAVKVADGGERASGPALIHALAALGALSEAQVAGLDRFARRPVTGGGRRVGDVVADFRLRRPRD